MRITELADFSFPVPFKTVFRHASASRAQAENLIVAARSACGQTGYGEGCPRDYVTGETQETGRAFIARHRAAIADAVVDMASLRNWIAAHRDEIDRNPSAFCAIEIAILDLLGKVTGKPVEALVGAPPLSGIFRYTAILGDTPYPMFRWQLWRYRNRGFQDFKIKLSGDISRDRRKLAPFRGATQPKPRVRVDANNLWTAPNDCIGHLKRLEGDLFAIEEPLQAGDLDGFAQVGRDCGLKVILDESATRVEHLQELCDPGRWIVNIRVSKMGGIIRSLEVAHEAAHQEIAVIVGAQVGETSLLTRAALTVMNAVRPVLTASEGAFGTILLKQDLTDSCIMFAQGGALDTVHETLGDKPGLGLQVRSEALT